MRLTTLAIREVTVREIARFDPGGDDRDGRHVRSRAGSARAAAGARSRRGIVAAAGEQQGEAECWAEQVPARAAGSGRAARGGHVLYLGY
ncbi:MAG: hypothetical protein L6Q83_11310 [Gammaproteobacteria bacterium]|nr:hypothetical protein [Gammaproteobacteria bacterium]